MSSGARSILGAQNPQCSAVISAALIRCEVQSRIEWTHSALPRSKNEHLDIFPAVCACKRDLQALSIARLANPDPEMSAWNEEARTCCQRARSPSRLGRHSLTVRG